MSRSFMLDTDIVSYALRGVGGVGERLRAEKPSRLCISAITAGELRFGVAKRNSDKLRRLVDGFCAAVVVEPFDEGAAQQYGALAALLERRGTKIGGFDTAIAAHAMALELTLVTNNTKHFIRVPGLRTESWV